MRPPRRFSSPLLNDENLRQGCLADNGGLIERVITGLKPLAFTDSSRLEVSRAEAQRALDAGLAVQHFR